MKISLLTSGSLRHMYLAECLKKADAVILQRVLVESKGAYYNSESTIIRDHLLGFEVAEQQLFVGSGKIADSIETKCIARGEVNAEENIEWISASDPDLVVIFGSSIVNAEWIRRFPERLINIHLGLSPYYRGTATNFWPLVFSEPQCVGATIHIATKKVDDGAVLHQVRPDIDVNDSCHTMGCKTIKAVIDQLPRILEAYSTGMIQPQIISGDGRLFRRSDFMEESVIAMQKNFQQGMLNDYLCEKASIDYRFPIVEYQGE